LKRLRFYLVFILIFNIFYIAGAQDKYSNEYLKNMPKPLRVNIIESLPVNPAMTLVHDMGIGINIGNTLDAIGTNDWHSGENGWGNPDITRDFIQSLKSNGYKSLRLPVTWAEYIGPAPDYKIGKCVFNCGKCPDRMDRVEQVVKWILAEDMYCVLNLHHDGGHSDKSWILDAENDFDKTLDQFKKVWEQIALRFSGVSQDKLIFESMNEVGFDKIFARSKVRAYTMFNSFNQAFVDTIRMIPGNENRFLLIAGYWTDIDKTTDKLFKMPADTIENRLIASLHYYGPGDFCIAESNTGWGFRSSWGTAEDYQFLRTQLNKLRKRFLNNGIPVIMGEYGVTLVNKNENSRIKWMTVVTQACLNYGIHPMLWDTGWKVDDNGKDFGGEVNRESPYALRNALKIVLSIINLRD